jgi:hypothetical protein
LPHPLVVLSRNVTVPMPVIFTAVVALVGETMIAAAVPVVAKTVQVGVPPVPLTVKTVGAGIVWQSI